MKSQFTFGFWLVVLMLGFVVNPTGLMAQEKTEKADVAKQEEKQDEETDFDELFRGAQFDISNENFKVAAVKFKRCYEENSEDEEIAFFYGYASHMSGDVDTGMKMFEKLQDSSDYGALSTYNLGCAYSLKSQPEKSVEFLHKAMDAGFRDWGQINGDPDLAIVKKSDAYKEIQARIDNNGRRPRKKFDAKGMVGEWVVKSGTRQGEEIAADRLPTVVFTENDLTIPVPENDDFVMSYTIVTSKENSIDVDFKIESGPAPEGTAVGIMKFEGNTAKLCYDPTGKKRPAEFKTSKEDGNFSFVMEKKKSAKFDPAKVVGKWNVVEGSRAGEKLTAERLAGEISFEKDKITMPAGEATFVMTYEINTETSPIQIDMKVESGPAPEGSPASGIVKFEDGKFVLCYNATGGDRPEKFDSTSENENFLFTMKAAEK